MKIHHLFIVIIGTVLATAAQAQVKIGDNLTVVQTASLLELETTNKGLSLPRLSLTSTTVWNLTGTPVAGMQVYNANTGITEGSASYPIITGGIGVYYWNGGGWVTEKG